MVCFCLPCIKSYPTTPLVLRPYILGEFKNAFTFVLFLTASTSFANLGYLVLQAFHVAFAQFVIMKHMESTNIISITPTSMAMSAYVSFCLIIYGPLCANWSTVRCIYIPCKEVGLFIWQCRSYCSFCFSRKGASTNFVSQSIVISHVRSTQTGLKERETTNSDCEQGLM
jgi:hypothetical protein